MLGHQLAAIRQPCEGRWAGVVWGELQLTVLGPQCWPCPSTGGLGQVAGRRVGSVPALWRKVGCILKEGWLHTEEGWLRTEGRLAVY
jgi:hypothetical protein